MEKIRELHEENFKKTETLAKESTIGQFLLKNHEDVFNNMNENADDMAKIPIKRYLMLSAESDGIDLLFKVGGNKLYLDEDFKLFINKMNEYFEKIKNSKEYVLNENYVYNEELIYEKFREIKSKLI